MLILGMGIFPRGSNRWDAINQERWYPCGAITLHQLLQPFYRGLDEVQRGELYGFIATDSRINNRIGQSEGHGYFVRFGKRGSPSGRAINNARKSVSRLIPRDLNESIDPRVLRKYTPGRERRGINP